MAYRMSAALAAVLLAAIPTGAALAQTATEPAPATPAETAPADSAAPAPATDAAPGTATEAAPAPAAEPAPADAPDAATTATDAAPAEGQPQPGTYYAKSTHGDWAVRCMRTPDGNDPCELYQLLKDDQDVAVAEVSVIPFEGEAAAIMNFVAPLETDLSAGLGFRVDSGAEQRYPFMVCAAVGCISRVGLTQAELGGLKRGGSGTVSLLPFGGDPEQHMVRLPLSLSGFTAGFDAMAAETPAAPTAPSASAPAPAPAE
ncbi:invasion associated locus B family protein [Paracoccus sp. Z118]|uniref:invasion associated locus B family protein n=1 Tax=Paracoccus sp. Z118 TaxID=2851017 RepID=UPI001C2B97CD|nr:invasion associated locus B family protein [Paracoccus sp. Z118]MBV0892419.1 invasion associated locus B family protein [Paracoccus sp. Z118]